MLKRLSFPRKNRASNWLAIGLVGLVGLIVVSMVLGILTNKESASPAAVSESRVANGTASQYAAGGAAPTVAASAPAPAKGAVSANQDQSSNPALTGSSASNQPLPADRLIIRNATVALNSTEVEKTLQDLRLLAVEKGGVVFQSSSSVRNDKTYANITIQVPSAAFDETMNRLRKLTGVKVDSENSTSQDVTEEYVDLQAQLNNLKATEAEFVRLLAKTSNITEILTVQRELNNVRSEIDRRQGRLNYLDKRTALSSIIISISPVGTVAKDEPKGWDAGQVLENAWAGSLKGLQGLFKVLVTLGVWAVWLVPSLTLTVWLLTFLYRRLAPKRPAAPTPPTPSEGATA